MTAPLNNTNLDEKLNELLWDDNLINSHAIDVEPHTEAIAAIKQAFKDAGYIQVVDNPHGINHVQVADFSKGKLSKLMSGKDWRTRFWDEYETELPKVIDASIIREQIDKVVKRASGLVEGDK